MALRMAMLRSAQANTGCGALGLRRWIHCVARPSPLDSAFGNTAAVSPQYVLPESDLSSDGNTYGVEFGFPDFPCRGGSMELMAVPRKKVSRHKRGIRNGPKALKPVPVIIRCRACGRVKLPHFFCCSGERENPGERNDTTS